MIPYILTLTLVTPLIGSLILAAMRDKRPRADDIDAIIKAEEASGGTDHGHGPDAAHGKDPIATHGHGGNGAITDVDSRLPRLVALTFAVITLVLSILAGVQFTDEYRTALDDGTYTYNQDFFLKDEVAWIEDANINYIVGVDGLSFPFIILTTALTVLCVLFQWKDTDRIRQYMSIFLFLEFSLIGVFIALDLVIFFIFWEIVLVPMYFLIHKWGYENRAYAAIKFFIYTGLASWVMFAGLFALYWEAGASSWYIGDIAREIPQATAAFQSGVFLALFFGFGVKLPMVPFHTWLPDAHVQAPTTGSVMLAAVLLKMGGYGLVRISYSMLPEGALEWRWVVFAFGVVSMVYAAFVCLAQTDIKRMIAYSSVSHMGFLLLGLSAGGVLAVSGAIFQMFNHGIVTAVLFMLTGVLKYNAGTREIPRLGGLNQRMPWASFILIVSFFASLGMPGLNGFVSEFMVFVGSYEAFEFLLLIPLLTIGVTGAYYLWTIQRVIMGDFREDLDDPETGFKVHDIAGHEKVVFIFLLGLIVLFGIAPQLVLWMIDPAAHAVSDIIMSAVNAAGNGAAAAVTGGGA